MTNNGAITLECPACGRVFLTLQHGGAMEICPHCANSAPRSAYFAVPVPTGQRDATPLPERRVEPLAPLVPMPYPDPVPEAPVHALPVHHMQPSWQALPPTTESAPVPAPSASAFFQQTPAAPLAFAPAPEISPPTATFVPASEVMEPPVPEPTWPGLGPTVTVEPVTAPALKPMRSPVAKSSAPTAQPSLNSVGPATEQDRRQPSTANGFMVFLAVIAMAFVSWFLWFQPEQITVPAPTKPTAAPSPPASTVPSAPKPAPPPLKVEPSVETRRAVPATVPPAPSPTPQSSNVADLIKNLETATTTDERLKVVADPAQNRESMEAFFNDLGGHLNPVRIEAGPVVTELTTGKDSPLYRLITAKCSSGAIVRLPSATGSALIDWPFFVQTHSLSFDQFASPNAPAEPKTKRFTLLMQRSRDFELPDPERSVFDSFLAQGSMSSAGTVRIYVAKDSVAGRLLATRMAWGKTYLVEALLGHTEIGGKRALAVLDCSDGIGSEQ